MRVSVIEAADAHGEALSFFNATAQLRGRIPNSAAVWGHIPRVARFQLLAGIGIQREGGGGVLSCRIKEMAVLKTSHVNRCAY